MNWEIIKKTAGICIIVYAVFLLLLFYSILIEPFNIEITENEFDFFNSGAPVKIVMIADVQGSYDYPEYFENSIQMINSQNPDLVVIVGDIVESEEQGWEKIDKLQKLESRYGIYAVLGNHDYYHWDCADEYSYEYADKIEQKLESLGIEVLRNENRILEIRNHSFTLIGVDDLWACRNDYEKAAAGIPDMPKLVLSHNYLAVSDETLANSLVLSGHTHCGHVYVPFITNYIAEQQGYGTIRKGKSKLNGGELYITCGLTPGDIRLFTRPEISILYLN